MKPHLKTALRAFGSGFHFSAAPPAGVDALEHLQSDDPEDVIACVLANFQHGYFDVAGALLPLLQRDDWSFTWAAGTALLAYGAPQTVIRQFFDRAIHEGEEYSRYHACTVALIAGNRWVVAPALELLPTLTDPDLAMFLQAYLSWLLEPTPGTIYWDVEPAPRDPMEWVPPGEEEAELRRQYVDAVHDAEQRVIALVSNPSVPFAEGEPLHVPAVARRLLERLDRDDMPSMRLNTAAHMFEASTGARFWAGFGESRRGQRLESAAVLEEFLESEAHERFTPGGRYFFGHRIPD